MAGIMKAWDAVAMKKAAPGIDQVSVEEFARYVPTELHRLHDEVLLEQYVPRDLITFPKKKADDGFRELTLPTVRDKILSRTVAQWLGRQYKDQFQPQCYAYRPGKGASRAAIVAERHSTSGKFTHAVRIDVRSYFDEIDHPTLHDQLATLTHLPALVDLIMTQIARPRFDGVARLAPSAGIPQGDPLAPVLSNLYLCEFDRTLNDEKIPFIRYADDIMLFAPSSEAAGATFNLVTHLLDDLKLTPHQDKSRVYAIENGVPFLGFVFFPDGKVPCRKAVKRLHEKLAEGPYDDENNDDFHTRRKAVVRGWNNYFKANSTASDEESSLIQTYDTLENVNDEATTRTNDAHDPRDGVNDTASSASVIDDALAKADDALALKLIRKTLTDDDSELSEARRKKLTLALADLYEKRGLRGAAAHCRKHAGILKQAYDPIPAGELTFGTRDVTFWIETFGAGHGPVYRQFVDATGRHGYRPASKTLTPRYLKDHWTHRHTLAVPVFDACDNCKFAVIDFDVSRKQLDNASVDEIEVIRKNLLQDAINLQTMARSCSMEALLEDSGYKGYHLWFFFHNPLDAPLVRRFLLALTNAAGEPPYGSHREIFPATNKRNDEHIGCRIKLPLGLHRLSGKPSMFLAPDGKKLSYPIGEVTGFAYRTTARAVKDATAYWRSQKDEQTPHDDDTRTSEPDEPTDVDLIAELEAGCAVFRALKQKAITDKQLTHYERLVVRGMLAPLGSIGKKNMHDILKLCDNYSKSVTDKMMVRPQGVKPMGCRRIKEILSDLCSQLDCNCSFKYKKNDYAHPLRHLKQLTRKLAAKTIQNNTTNETLDHTHIHRATESVLEKVKIYKQKKRELLLLQTQIEKTLDENKEADTPYGTLRADGHDTTLKNWTLSL